MRLKEYLSTQRLIKTKGWQGLAVVLEACEGDARLGVKNSQPTRLLYSGALHVGNGLSVVHESNRLSENSTRSSIAMKKKQQQKKKTAKKKKEKKKENEEGRERDRPWCMRFKDFWNSSRMSRD